MTAAAHSVYQAALAARLGGRSFFATLTVLEAQAGTRVADLGKPARKP